MTITLAIYKTPDDERGWKPSRTFIRSGLLRTISLCGIVMCQFAIAMSHAAMS